MVKVRKDQEVSANIEDRRGQAPPRGGLPMGRGAGVGAGGGLLAIIALIASVCLTQGGGSGGGFDIGKILFPTAGVAPGGSVPPPASSAEEDEMIKFVSFVLDDSQQTWAQLFRDAGKEYREAKLVLFRSGVQSGCGPASSAMGPFYCPPDERVFIDLDFFNELETKFAAPGDFAQAYVIAHEIGHHVQNVLGTNESVRREQQRNPSKANDLSIRLELQADCYAGVWAFSTYDRGNLDDGDIDEGLTAATAVGDDYIQKNLGGGRVNPESWTHGSSEQRKKWFSKGFESGDPNACDTFSVSKP
jgi:hypothetical protein